MKTQFLKNLWMLRFEKLKKTEEEAAWIYQEVLDFCLGKFGPDDPIIPLLTKLVREERLHSKLADELISICRRTHPEIPLY